MNDRSAAGQRVIRVFVSSTFQDMHAEREELVKRTFPALRRLCSQRGVIWSEIDLRWGVTTVEKAEGRVLPICLEEIRRCRPYFIGILGERYGWVPEDIAPELIQREPWLRDHLRKSVTELEILHGVLRNPEMAEHAYFYFRDLRYIDTIPQGHRDDFVSRGAENISKLRKLKEAIRHSGFPVKEDYADPKELGQLVLADLTTVINRLFPEGSVPEPLDREAAEHEAFAVSRSEVYIGRPEYFDRLEEHATGGGLPLVVLGPSGSGKSALLANWALRRGAAHAEELLILHFIGSSPASCDWAAMLRRIMGELKRHFDIDEDIPDKPDALRVTFANWLSMADSQMSHWSAGITQQLQKLSGWARQIVGRPKKFPLPNRLLIVLDAVNQLDDHEGALDLVWLPPVIPPRVRLIVSTLPGRTLDDLTTRSWPTLSIQPLEMRERQQFITDYLWRRYSKKLDLPQLQRVARSDPASNPLYLRGVLEELRQFGIHEELDSRIDYYLQAKNPVDLYRLVLRRWEDDYGKDLVCASMSLLWAARRGLSESELLACLGGQAKPIPRAKWSPVYLACAESLVSRAGLLSFFHDYLRQAVQDLYLRDSDAQSAVHLRLADYFDGQERTVRQVDELPWQLSQAGEWRRLSALLSNEQFFDSAWAIDPFEVKSHWAHVETNSQFGMLEAYRSVLQEPGGFDPNYVWSLTILLHDAGYVTPALHLAKHVVEYTQSFPDMKAVANALGGLAAILQMGGELDRAMELHKTEQRLCRQVNDREGLARSLGNQAVILHLQNRYEDALRLHKEEEALCREIKDYDGLQRSMGNQGLIMHTRGNLQEALSLHHQQGHICLELGNKQGLANSSSGQGIILRAQGKYEEAMRMHKSEEAICRDLGNRHGIAVSLGNQAVLARLLGNGEEALKLHKEEERLCRELGNKTGLSISLGNQAVIYSEREDYQRALILHREEEQICKELGDNEGEQTSRLNQGAILQKQKDLDGALLLYKQAEETYRSLDIPEGLAFSLVNQAWVWGLERDEIAKALPLADEAYAIASRGGYAALATDIESIRVKLRDKLKTL